MTTGPGRRARGRRRRGALPARPARGRRPADRVTAVVNTGDDTVLHGLSISPDLDTITYTLAGAIDPERGLGPGRRDVAGDGGARPLRRGAARRLGRRADLVQPRRPRPRDPPLPHGPAAPRARRSPRSPTRSRRAWGLGCALLPMTDDRFRTIVELADSGEVVSFQDYFVRLRHGVPVAAVRFDHDGADLDRGARSTRSSSAERRGDRTVEPARVDRPDPGAARRSTTLLAGAPRSGRRRVADRRWRGAQGAGRPDARRARPSSRRWSASPGSTRPIAGTLVIDDGRRRTWPDAVEATGMRCVVDLDGDVDAVDRRRRWPRTCLTRVDLSATLSAGPRRARSTGDQPRWIRARTGETREARQLVGPRRAPARGSGPPPADSSVPQVADRRLLAGADVDHQPAARGCRRAPARRRRRRRTRSRGSGVRRR